MKKTNFKFKKKLVCLAMLFAVLKLLTNFAAAETPANYNDEQKSEISEYMYGISISAEGGKPEMAIQLCDELSNKYKDYTRWSNVIKAATYINNPIYFDKDVNATYLQALNLLEKELPFEKLAEDRRTDYNLIGNAYYGMKDYKNAVDAYDKSFELSKNKERFGIEFYYNRGCSKALLGDYKGALEDFNNISLDEYDEKYEGFIVRKEILQKLLSGKKDVYFPESEINAQGLHGFFIMALASEDYKKASELTDYAMKLLPNSSKGYELKGILCFEQKKYAQAENFFDEALKKNPKELSVYYSRSEMYYNRKMYEKALADVNKNLEIKNSNGYLLRAKIKYAMNDCPGALSDFESAKILNISAFDDLETLYLDYPKLKTIKK